MRKRRERARIDKNWTYSVASFVRLEVFFSSIISRNIEECLNMYKIIENYLFLTFDIFITEPQIKTPLKIYPNNKYNYRYLLIIICESRYSLASKA